MAIANIRNRIEGIHERLRRDSLNARDMANRRFTTKITIHAKEFAYAMAEAINAAADAQNLSRGIAREDEVRAATWNVIGDWSRGIFGTSAGFRNFGRRNNVKCEHTSYGAEVIREAPSAAHGSATPYLRIVNQQFRRDVLEKWKLRNDGQRSLFEDVEYTDDFVQDGRWGTGFSHDIDTNVATAGLVNWIEELGDEIIPVNSYYTNTNIAQRVLDALEINWEQEVNPESGRMEWVIKGELGGINPEPGDEDLTQEWEDHVIRKLDEILADDDLAFYDPDFVASKPFSEVAAEETVIKLVKPYKRLRDPKTGRFVKMTNIPKKNKISIRSGKGKPRKRTKKAKSGTFKTAAAATSMRKEKGSMRNTEAGAIQLAKLKRLINRRLPAEVRRNMGRPALQNQTGRFSSSVQLLSLMEGPKTLIGKYTYLLSPYETFENSGKRQWPTGYNPKTLISKSIRNLAENRIAQKLTLRRV